MNLEKEDNIFEINGVIYGFSVTPWFDNVLAQIVRKPNKTDNHDFDIDVLKKEFGGWFRKPIKKDYENARRWLDEQIMYMIESNRQNNYE